MTDIQLLELAYRAYRPGENYIRLVNDAGPNYWNPLVDDGAALRLMATLNINVFYRENINGAFVIADHAGIEFCPESLDGPHEWDATRRAIVRAAAEIGKSAS